MLIENWKIERVTPYGNNPRKNSGAVDRVAKSIKEFGFRQPIVVDENGIIIVGHTRFLACKKLGITEVPIHVATDLTAQQVKAYRIADNRTNEFSEWDEDLLAIEINDLINDDYPVELTGFELDELPGYEPPAPPEPPTPEPGKELNEKWGVKTGDLWEIGNHRLLCGDSTKEEDVHKLLGEDKPGLMVTDPPYGVSYDADWRNHTGDLGRSARAVGKVVNDDRADWSETWSHYEGDVAYIWHAGNKAHIVAESLINSGLDVVAQIIWAKNNMVIGRGNYHPKHEPCWYVVRKGGTRHFTEDRTQTTLWEIDKPQKSETGHSTQKPVECMARAIRNHEFDMVYDPFLGSGTTLIACEHLNRKCRGIEISPEYCAVILERVVTTYPDIKPARVS